MTKTGPNDARRIVWANSKFFFSFLRFYITNYSIRVVSVVSKGRRGAGKAVTRRTDWRG